MHVKDVLDDLDIRVDLPQHWYSTDVSNEFEDADLVENDEIIKIKVEGEKNIIFEVKVADGDMGKVIGRQGKIAQSIRTVMKAVANRKDKKVTVEFIG